MAISWDKTLFFQVGEFDDPKYPGSGSLINGSLLIMLVKLRKETMWPIIIHNSVGGAVDKDGKYHSINSLHNLSQGCLAVDMHFKTNVSLREQYFELTKIGFGGIGFYPEWRNPGFHVDIRPKNKTQRWVVINNQYVYLLR